MVLMGKPGRKRLLDTPRQRWEDIIKMDGNVWTLFTCLWTGASGR
jgi:hypothetical protein